MEDLALQRDSARQPLAETEVRVLERLGGKARVLTDRTWNCQANSKTIVVLNAGSPVSMNWLDRVGAVLQAWYRGQESGKAIVDALFGDVNPSGKLATSWPKRLQDNPAFINYPSENGKVAYREGLFVGYRYYDMKDLAPLFPFSHGLSYTTFAYHRLEVEDTGDEIRVVMEVQNIGERAGQEIVQVYVRAPKSRLARPEKELKNSPRSRSSRANQRRLRSTSTAKRTPTTIPRSDNGSSSRENFMCWSAVRRAMFA